MNAIDLLMEDHRLVENLLEEIESTTERGVKTRRELFRRLKLNLTVHEIIEETIFYPALKAHPKAKEIVLEGYEEHHVVDEIMEEIAEVPYDDETWGAKAKVMSENIKHHIEEEESEMFKQARQAFSREELQELGEQMAQRKQEAMLEQEAAIAEEMGEPVGGASRGGAMA
jgi:hemerythrin-like domain-containing protein